jgi:hypothetical protein
MHQLATHHTPLCDPSCTTRRLLMYQLATHHIPPRDPSCTTTWHFTYHHVTLHVPPDDPSCTTRQPFVCHQTTLCVPPDNPLCTTRQPFVYHQTTLCVPPDNPLCTTRQPFPYNGWRALLALIHFIQSRFLCLLYCDLTLFIFLYMQIFHVSWWQWKQVPLKCLYTFNHIKSYQIRQCHIHFHT